MNIDKLSCDDTIKYISLLKEYINMLDKELKETSPLAYAKGWRSTQVEYGVELRKKLNVYDKSFDAEPTRWKRYRFYTKNLDEDQLVKSDLEGFDAILKGEVDELPENAFAYVGTIDEAIEKHKKSAA